MATHPVCWTAPTPLWGRFLLSNKATFLADDQERPALLRFASDDFMDQVMAMLAADPRQIGEVIARPETWRTPLGDAPDLVERIPLPRMARVLARARKADAANTTLTATSHQDSTEENSVTRTVPLKLYHPAHQRYYLVAANLVCAIPGFPDRGVAAGGREQVGFVLRRLMLQTDTAAQRSEYAFVKNASGARWQLITATGDADHAGVADGEEILPLFPLNFHDDTGHPRRIHAGLIPVGRREEYMSSRKENVIPSVIVAKNGNGKGNEKPTPATIISERKEQLKMEVVEPWRNLVRQAYAAVDSITDTTEGSLSGTDKQKGARKANERLQAQSWLVLLDFADYLATHLPRVSKAIDNPAKESELVSQAEKKLFNWLKATETDPGAAWQITTPAFALSLREALQKVRTTSARDALERAVNSYPATPESGQAGETLQWPAFLYLLAGVRESSGSFSVDGKYKSLGGSDFTGIQVPETELGNKVPDPPAPLRAMELDAALLDKLVQLVVAAIDTTEPAKPAPPLPFALRLRDALDSTKGDEGWFVLRCVYVRCDCGPLQPVVLSAPSQQFQLASFFDPDAPARPIRISLPLDTTPAGLRKHNKNTALMVSDVLCGQISRAKGLGLIDLIRAVLPWPLHKDLDVDGVSSCKNANNNSIGMICSLSIPIVTICALILLMIIVSLLDMIFRWMPYLIMCFPIPGALKAKAPKTP